MRGGFCEKISDFLEFVFTGDGARVTIPDVAVVILCGRHTGMSRLLGACYGIRSTSFRSFEMIRMPLK